MMTNKALVLETLKRAGKMAAEAIQVKSESMTGTELYEEEDFIPNFKAAVAKMNMLVRAAGFLCKSSAGRIVKLLQPYDSTVYAGEPEEYPSMWGFYWSTDPAKAKPFVAISTSPFMIGDCCLNNAGEAKRSTIDNNVWSPDSNPEYWEDATE